MNQPQPQSQSPSLEKKPPSETPTEPVIIEEKITRKTGEVVIKKYLKGRVLGKGGFATCYEVTDIERNKVLAAKIVSKASLTKKRALEKLLAEIKIHKSLQHEHIVAFEHVFEDKENVYIILEICTNDTLKEQLRKQKRFTDSEVAMYISHTIFALIYLHGKKIIHRDLKLGNLLLGKNLELKLADFGLAAKIEQDGEKRRTICGTPNYIAPEVLDKKTGHSYEVDVWSLGVICYTLLVGRPPFETNDTKATYRKILKASYTFPTNVQVSENGKDFVKRILVLDPSKRPTLKELLEHPFLKLHIPKPLSPLLAEPNSGLKKRLMLQPHQSPNSQPFSASADKAFLKNFMTVNKGDFTPDREIDENEIYGQGSLKKINNFTMANTKIRSSDVRHDITNMVVPRAIGLYQDKLDIQLRPDYETIVTKYVDYSSKYGLGYLLADGTAGLVFKDLSRITLSPDGLKFEYMRRKVEEKKEILITCSTSDYPKELKKKVAVINYFKNYLEGTRDLNEEKPKDEEEKPKTHDKIRSMPLVYIKKWTKTKHAYLFRLSNRIVQVDFKDKSQIILSQALQLICYKNKKGETSQHPLATAMEADYPEMIKRLKYTKGILAYVKNGGSNHKDGNLSGNLARRLESDLNDPKTDANLIPLGSKDANTGRISELNLIVASTNSVKL